MTKDQIDFLATDSIRQKNPIANQTVFLSWIIFINKIIIQFNISLEWLFKEMTLEVFVASKKSFYIEVLLDSFI